jgi:hypothetical protein
MQLGCRKIWDEALAADQVRSASDSEARERLSEIGRRPAAGTRTALGSGQPLKPFWRPTIFVSRFLTDLSNPSRYNIEPYSARRRASSLTAPLE